VPNCAEAGVLGAVTGLVGTAQACEAIKLLAGVGEPLSGRLLIWDALSMTSNIVALRRDAGRKPVTELPPDGYGETCEPEFAPDEIDSAGLRVLFGAGKRFQLLDVREGWEREMGRIEPSTHVPLGRLEVSTAADIAPLDPAVQTVVYCAHGIRSLRGMRILRERHGFRSAVSLRGGMMAWSR
jgi:rhodanese-related sulfurtransferase